MLRMRALIMLCMQAHINTYLRGFGSPRTHRKEYCRSANFMTGFDEEAANVTMFFNFARHQVLNLLYKIRKVLRTQMLLAGATICAEARCKEQEAKNSADFNSHIAQFPYCLAAGGVRAGGHGRR